MGVVASVVCVVAAVLVTVRWRATRVDALGRRRGFPRVAVAVLGVAAVAFTAPAVARARTEQRLSDVASVLAGRSVTVHCRSAGAELVHVGPDLGRVDTGADGRPASETTLGHGVCAGVERWRSDLDDDRRGRADVDAATAVHVLTHEAMHLSGRMFEGQAECAAVQRDALTARLLGAAPAQARRLARTYWLVVYPTLPDPYRTPQCAAGQAFDEHLGDAPWSP